MKRTVGVIGGEGKMGSWLRRFFASAGCPTLSADRHTSISPHDLVERCDVLILSVPIKAAVHLAREIGPLLRPDQLLTDVCSLKRDIVSTMQGSTKAQVVGMHPLFGPATASIQGQNVILCPIRPSDGFAWLRQILEAQGAVVTVTDPETHDRTMAVVQALTHWMTITLAAVLNRQLDIDSIERFATPVFRLQLGLIGRLLHQDPELYDMLIAHNPEGDRMIETFLVEGEKLRRAFVHRQEGTTVLTQMQADVGQRFQAEMERLEAILDRGLAPLQPSSDTASRVREDS
uniref:Prephenate dehydrogenase/arogenate dehydrogenase family protein n=1 Tax=Desulfatirhabdium butyrativorans TaxID=340467 RepID=A0A7C4VRI5_9BACT